MPRQARKLSGTGIRHVILCRHSPAGKTDRCLFRSNTIIVANEMITSPHDSPIYGLDGQRRTQMQRGLNIVRKDGKAVKLISK